MCEELKKFSAWGGVFVGLGLVIASGVLGTSYMWNGAQATKALEVTGAATEMVKADKATLHSSFARVVVLDSLKDGYNQMKSDQSLVEKFFASQGVKPDELTIAPVSMNVYYDGNNQGGPTKYNLTQDVTLQTTDLAKADKIAKSFQNLIDQGVIFSTFPVEYYYSKLPDLKVKLLGDAMKDAKTRAQKLAESAGQGVGELRSAASGVVQVLAPNSTDVSDYGTYDTRTVDKQVMVTVRTKWGVR